MNARAWPERLLRQEEGAEPELPLTTEGVQRLVWESKFGAMLIEVRDGEVFVNGQRVEPAEAPGRAAATRQSS